MDECSSCNIVVETEKIYFKVSGQTTCAESCGDGFYGDIFSRTCRSCSTGCSQCTSASTCSVCASGSYLKPDSTCATLTSCVLGETYQTRAPTATSDRVCGNVKTCSALEYISTPATLTTDLQCSACTQCDPAFQEYQANTCRGTVDGVCVLIDRCRLNPCNNGGTCVNNTGYTFACECPSGYCGSTCNAALVNDVCPLSAASSSGSANRTASTLGAAIGGIAGLIILLAIAIILVRRSSKPRDPTVVSAVTIGRFRERRNKQEADEWELKRDLLVFSRELGSGNFGVVRFALLKDPSDPNKGREVAVKEAIDAYEGSKQEREFVREMNMMKILAGAREAGKPAPPTYPYVVGLVGVCTLHDPLLLVVEYADQGDLRNYLRDRMPKRGRPAGLTVEELAIFSAQAACGMNFLASHRVSCGPEREGVSSKEHRKRQEGITERKTV